MFRSNANVNYKALWRPRLKRLGIAMAALVGLVVVFLLVERVRGVTGLNRRTAQLKHQGEKLSVAYFEPARANPETDAAGALLSLSNRLQKASSLWNSMPPSGRFTQPGQMIQVTTIASWSYDKKTNAWIDVVDLLAQDKSLSADVRAALLLPGWNDGCNYRSGFIDFQLGPFVMWKNLSQCLAVSALAALQSNDIETAVERIEDGGRLLKHQANSPLLISQLVRFAEAAIVWNATWEVVISEKCSEPQLARLQAAWEGMDFTTDTSRAMAMERNMTLVHYDLIVGSIEKREKAMEELAQAAEFGLASRPPSSGFTLRHLHMPVWQFSWARQDELRSLNRWQSVIEFDRDARSNSWASVSHRVGDIDDEIGIITAALANEDGLQMNFYDRMRYLFSSMTFSIGSHTTLKAMQRETQRRMMVGAIALERRKLSRGKYPSSFGEVVPEFLSAVPIDLMNNQPLRIKLTADGSSLVYSAGENGRDDGGSVEPSNATASYKKIWDGKDAVWPQPASTQDAEKVAHQK